MAKFDFEIPSEMFKQLFKLENIDEIAPKMINEAMPILENNFKSELSKHKRTGAMMDSVKRTKAKATKNGYYAIVRPTGESTKYMDDKGVIRDRKKPVRNMEILAHNEYGTSKEPPIPILTKAIKDSESGVLDKMQEVFNREASK